MTAYFCRTIFNRSKCILRFTRVFSGKFSNIKNYRYRCDLNIDVNHNVYSNNCSLLYVRRFLVGNILYINLKAHFTRWRFGDYRMLPVMNCSILMSYLNLTSRIPEKNQKIKTLNVSSALESSPKMKIEKYGLST